MKINIIDIENGDVSIETELLSHPVIKSENEHFKDAFFFEDATFNGKEIITGNFTILLYYSNTVSDIKFFTNEQGKYAGFTIIRKYYLKSDDLFLLIAQK